MLGLDIIYIHAKFDHYGFSLSGAMVCALQNLNGSRDLTTPLSEIVIHGLALININRCSKFEVSISTHYEDTKGVTK